MPSCSADGGGRTPSGPSRGPWRRLLVVALLVAAALTGPAVGYAAARFGDTATVTISISVGPAPAPSPDSSTGSATTGAPSPDPVDGPVDEPVEDPVATGR